MGKPAPKESKCLPKAPKANNCCNNHCEAALHIYTNIVITTTPAPFLEMAASGRMQALAALLHIRNALIDESLGEAKRRPSKTGDVLFAALGPVLWPLRL